MTQPNVAVIGGGIVGACAAWRLASDGARVTVFEQYELDHDRGSSYGDSRIIRRFYDDATYTELMGRAYPLWRELETKTGQTLVLITGGLYFGPALHPRLAAAEAGLSAAHAAYDALDAVALRRRFPQFWFDGDEAGLMDREAGLLRASACVRAAVSAAQELGATFHFGAHVSGLDDRVLRKFDRVVVCPGSWAAKLLPQLHIPVRPTKQQYIFLKPTRQEAQFELGSMPVWVDALTQWYGFPRHGDIQGVKIACHDFGPDIDPDSRARDFDESLVGRTREYARRRLPALADGEVTFQKVCLYEVTPDEDFVVDRIPGDERTVIVAGLSGHGFKFAPLLGALATDLTLGREPASNIDRLRISRFSPTYSV